MYKFHFCGGSVLQMAGLISIYHRESMCTSVNLCWMGGCYLLWCQALNQTKFDWLINHYCDLLWRGALNLRSIWTDYPTERGSICRLKSWQEFYYGALACAPLNDSCFLVCCSSPVMVHQQSAEPGNQKWRPRPRHAQPSLTGPGKIAFNQSMEWLQRHDCNIGCDGFSFADLTEAL